MCHGQNPAKWFPEGFKNDTYHLDRKKSQADIVADREYAERVCKGCPVQAQCLDFAISTKERWGIYGGVSEHDRRTQRRQLVKQLRKERREARMREERAS